MSALTAIESTRFGPLQVEPENVLEFPHGLIGLGGRHYTLLDRNPGSGFLWLHSLDDPALALPVVDPRDFFDPFPLGIQRLRSRARRRRGPDRTLSCT